MRTIKLLRPAWPGIQWLPLCCSNCYSLESLTAPVLHVVTTLKVYHDFFIEGTLGPQFEYKSSFFCHSKVACGSGGGRGKVGEPDIIFMIHVMLYAILGETYDHISISSC